MDKDGDSVDEAKPISHQVPERHEKPQLVPPPKDNKHVSEGSFLSFLPRALSKNSPNSLLLFGRHQKRNVLIDLESL